MLASLDVFELGRSLVILLHLMAVMAAAVGVAFGDYSLFAHKQVNRQLLLKAASATTWALVLLWVTGLTVVWLDAMSFGLLVSDSPKLLAKLTVVVALSANGWLLHLLVFDRIGLVSTPSKRPSQVAACLGGVSVASWLYALFLGVAKPWTTVLGYDGFIAGYLIVVSLAVLVSMVFVAPRLTRFTPIADVTPVSVDVRRALATVIGPYAGFFIERDVGLTLEEIDAQPVDSVTRIAAAVGQFSGFYARGPGMTRHLFEQAAAAALKKRGLSYHAYALDA